MKVLSLFDGMSCGQIALNKIGITDYVYYASEIEKSSIAVTQRNYPFTIQLGDILELDEQKLKGLNKIDLLNSFTNTSHISNI
ncbi:DNA cytosine methyltransferase [Bacillus velezensis]|uniref:DNA cytosine methyltransferase n=1 Tax=Bacillus velezensis TaxID=492670 RepID=UPI001C035B6A|nr:DNA cytosine methyltransferase [Bacillus velezensis]QWK23456.1 DNA cytosine methyltransferase [Bacillus velezensis]